MSEINSHYNFEVQNGSLINRISGSIIREPAVVMMTDIGSPIKLGEYSMCEKYFNTLAAKLPKDMLDDEYELIKFNIAYPDADFQPEGYNLTIDEVCTLFNYLQHHSIGGEGWAKIKAMNLDELKAKLAQVSEWLKY